MIDIITTESIKNRLESLYGVLFEVTTEHSPSGVLLRVALVSDYNEYFSMCFFASNRIRLKICIKPDAYSQPLFQSMALADTASRELFKKYAAAIQRESRTASFSVNGIDLFELDIAEWPIHWNSADLQIEVFPIPECETESALLGYMLPWVEKVSGLMFSLIDIDDDVIGEEEGSSYSVTQNKYERSKKNRAACLAHYGYRCQICNIDFEKTYGAIGANFIHVHHVVPVSQIGDKHVIDPIKDLVPICPNCHAMLHRKNPPLLPEELRTMLNERNGR